MPCSLFPGPGEGRQPTTDLSAMTEPHLIRSQRPLLQNLVQLVADRAAAEPEIEAAFKATMENVENEFQEARQQVTDRQTAARDESDREIAQIRGQITTNFETEQRATQKRISDTRKRIMREYATTKHATKTEFQETRWTIQAMLEADRNRAEAEWKQAQERVAEERRRMQSIQLDANRVVVDWRQDDESDEELEEVKPALIPGEAPRNVPECIARAEAYLHQLTAVVLPGFVQRRRLLWFGALVWLLIFSGLAFLTEGYYLVAVGLLAAVGFALGGNAWLKVITRRQIFHLYVPLGQILARAAILCTRYLSQVRVQYKRLKARSKKKHTRELRKAYEKYQKQRRAIKERRDGEWHKAEEELRNRWAVIRKLRDMDSRKAEEKYQRLQTEIKVRYETEWEQAHNRYFRLLADNKKKHDAEREALASRWREGIRQTAALVAEIHGQNKRLSPPWDDPSWETWVPPTTLPPGIRFGEYTVTLQEIPGGLPQDEQLRMECPAAFTLPACLSFPDRCSVMFKASEEGRTAAVESLQAVMLRFLTTLPPGKVRFTIIDPVGLGQNFAAFMHLADYDEALVASRIWTEMPHIEQRLTDLTGHMENVIQKYLRNQFQSIEEYNANAGEVAEPFRVLVVANFPANFSAEAARRLVSIASSGARCGVYTLITVDTKLPLPQGFNLADLEQPSVNLVWRGDRFLWKDSDFEKYPLRVDGPPPAEFCTRLMHRVGERAKDANRVEVPFEFIAPPPEQWWTGDSRQGIRVPLGRAGATKRQHLHLGQGTAHHVLIAGKTGSGKSTLLHALITNLSLHYSPEEVELYLVDFKKGVEFKTYATHELPHARVVAVESEREFGLSVLQRLDAELRQRGDRFREAGAQNLAGYREAHGREAVPRILLIVDEFQEFFIEDDKISQEAAQLLDRLVRQGRAFGLHVLLGSQTLGGAYTLARSTIDQMAVRIALQCSEADGHIILSDDNSAARLLSRPGEAIYNDANGLVEGNNPFQVVWLSDDDREGYLRRVHRLDRNHGARPQIVFEGNAPADVSKNHLLHDLLHNADRPAARRSSHAWLGEAMAIKDPTAAVFRPQSASNLLMVGQHEESALGILATALISLAAQHPPIEAENPPPTAQFYILDGAPDDSPLAGYLGRLAEILPQKVRVGSWREVAGFMGELADEVDRRQKTNSSDAGPVFLFIYGLQRFRDLRRQEDDFSFSRRGEEKPTPAKLFTTILREGPSLGVHALIWCDSLNNVNRSLDRQGMREFELRVLFQMSATDSSVLIDTPLAGKLGLHRALFHSEDQGKLEKFRPYGLPPEAWLADVRKLILPRRVGDGVLPAVP
jgi:hypothetical protein